MHVEIKVKLTSPLLGSKRSTRKVKTLAKDRKEENIAFDIPRFDWALREAARSLDMEDLIRPNMIHADGFYKKPTIIIYERSVRRRGVPKPEMYEAIQTGAVLTWKFVLTDAPPGTPGRKHLSRPTVEQLTELLQFIGAYLGMSQYGSNLGFGRFEIWKETAKKEKNENAEIRQSIYNACGRNDSDSRE